MISEDTLIVKPDQRTEQRIKICRQMLDEIDESLGNPAGLKETNRAELLDEREIIIRDLGRLISQQTIEGGE